MGRSGLGQYEDFDVAFGQLPDNTGQLTFKALQTYSDGKIVRWIDEAKSGGEEPENPAPVVKLTAKAAAGEGRSASATSSGVTKSADSSSSAASGSDSTARGLGIAGLIVGLLGLAAAVFAVARGRSAGSRGE
ncbi:hypothetical protein SALBM311S_01239 [Streptomyces alboniger]